MFLIPINCYVFWKILKSILETGPHFMGRTTPHVMVTLFEDNSAKDAKAEDAKDAKDADLRFLVQRLEAAEKELYELQQSSLRGAELAAACAHSRYSSIPIPREGYPSRTQHLEPGYPQGIPPEEFWSRKKKKDFQKINGNI